MKEEKVLSLVKLAADDSVQVRRKVLMELKPLEPVLADLLEKWEVVLSKKQQEVLRPLLVRNAGASNHLRSVTITETPSSLFHPGELVQHKRYRYKGVIVDWDPVCKASDAWYYSNRTQPDKNQPWYHVLVHNSVQVTYSAQSSIEHMDSEEGVNHPLVEHFFADFVDGEYIRNEVPWKF